MKNDLLVSGDAYLKDRRRIVARCDVMLSVLLLCLSLGAPVSASPIDTDRVRAVIERHNANAARWYALGDVDSVASVFADDAWQMPPNSPALVGREAIRAYWRQAVQWGKWDFTLETQKVDVCGRMAVERGKYILKFTAGPAAPPGMVSFKDRGNYLVHWRREGGDQWRVVADAPVSEVPLQPQPSPAAR